MSKTKKAYLLSPLTVKNKCCPADKAEIRLDDGGGLFLRIRRDGTKTFLFRYGGLSRTLGRWPKMELAEARKLAAELHPVRRGTGNPIREANERERRAKEEVESQRRREAAAGVSAEYLFERFIEVYGSSHWTPKWINQTRCLWRLHATKISTLKASDVRREHLMQACDKLLEAGKHDAANRLHKLARQVFSWALERELLAINPLADAKKKPAPNALPKTRAMSFDELRTLLNRIPAANISGYAKGALRLILATACRPGEILGARWQWFDRSARLLRLPRTKNGLPHDVPLSGYALRVVDELAAVRLSDWLIPQSMNSDMALRVDTLGSLIRDRQMYGDPIRGRTQSECELFMLPGGTWTAHDLRRTAASRLRELGVEPHVIEAVLHHVPARLVRTYQTYDDLPARRRALDRLGAALERLERGDSLGAEVIALKAG